MIRVAKMKKYDVSNGPGVRSVIFFSGCAHNCKGCFNKEAQSFNYGEPFTEQMQDEFIEYTKDSKVKGISILGGEPLQQDIDILIPFLKKLVQETNKDIWMWTGYTYDEVAIGDYSEILRYVDVLIDGKFEEAKKDLNLEYRGSTNQRVIDLGLSEMCGTLLLYQDSY